MNEVSYSAIAPRLVKTARVVDGGLSDGLLTVRGVVYCRLIDFL